MSSKIIDNANDLCDQLREKSIRFLRDVEYQSLMFVDLDSSNKQFDARLQSANNATIDKILRHKMSDIILKNQCDISEKSEHLMT
jgi:glycine/serine hydroxymethyltransferase